MKKSIMKMFMAIVLAVNIMILPVCAADSAGSSIQPYYAHTQSATLSIGFDMDNVIYCSLVVVPYSTGTGTSGLMKLYDSSGALLATWSISDYESPIAAEHTYQGKYGERYTVTYGGYVYGNNMTAPDRIDLSITDSCVDYN